MLIAEPVHGTGYLPLYIGIAKNLFEDVTVKIVTIETGAGHTNAVLSGQAFAFIGGPEHCAYAKAKGAELRSVVNCVDRGNVYFCAAKGMEPTNTDWASLLQRQDHRHQRLWRHAEFDHALSAEEMEVSTPTQDVTLVETANSAILPVVRNKQAQIGCSTEPFVTQGVRAGVWGEPFINIPKMMGPYAYSTFNVRLDSVQKTPELVNGFVRGMMKSLKFVDDNHDEAAEIAKKQFPTMALDDLKATLDRSFADESVEQGRHHQPRLLGHRQGRGHGRGPAQGRRQVRRDHRHELRRQAQGQSLISSAIGPHWPAIRLRDPAKLTPMARLPLRSAPE